MLLSYFQRLLVLYKTLAYRSGIVLELVTCGRGSNIEEKDFWPEFLSRYPFSYSTTPNLISTIYVPLGGKSPFHSVQENGLLWKERWCSSLQVDTPEVTVCFAVDSCPSPQRGDGSPLYQKCYGGKL